MTDLSDFLETKYRLYNRPDFIESDPISIPHLFSAKQDIEISGFLTAVISWGQRPTILKNARSLMAMMDDHPYEFVKGFTKSDLRPFVAFKHRTFNSVDLNFFLTSLKRIYSKYPSMEDLLLSKCREADEDYKSVISAWRQEFFGRTAVHRSMKHFSNPEANSAAKRINMFMRWMVRRDEFGVDFGIWSRLSPALLTCPLDVHSGRVARKLGLLHRTQDDWKAASELTAALRTIDPADPVKYDFALFGLGVFEKF